MMYHVAENDQLHEGALDHDTEMLLRDEVLNELGRRGVDQADAIASIRRVLEIFKEER